MITSLDVLFNTWQIRSMCSYFGAAVSDVRVSSVTVSRRSCVLRYKQLHKYMYACVNIQMHAWSCEYYFIQDFVHLSPLGFESFPIWLVENHMHPFPGTEMALSQSGRRLKTKWSNYQVDSHRLHDCRKALLDILQ